MPRPRTKGSVEWVGDDATGHWRARIPVGPKQRRWIELPASIGRDREAKARAEAKKMADLASAGKLVLPAKGATSPPPKGETLTDWSTRWFASRELRGLRSGRADRAKFTTWVLSRLGARPVADLTRAEIEAWVEWIDRQVQAEKLAWKSAQNVWGLLSKAMGDASGGKVQALRARPDNPAAGVAPPERGVEKAKQWLYPSEFLKLVSCPAIDVEVRRTYAVAVYLYSRAGETEALHWDDLVLEHGTVHVHRAADPDSGVVRETKGRAARRFEIEPNLLPLLRAMREARPKDNLVFDPWPLHKDRAGQLRDHLKLAGITRAELFENSLTTKNLTFHDLRATGTTWAAVRGDEPLKIMHRAGHKDLATTMKYVREAENVRANFGTVFPELPLDLLGSLSQSLSHGSGGSAPTTGNHNRKGGSGRGIRTPIAGTKIPRPAIRRSPSGTGHGP